MDIEFDPNKGDWTRRERGFGFSFAARIFLGRILMSYARTEGGEVRMRAVGEIEGVVYTVIFADQGEVRRIISARRASRKERKEWLASE